MQNLGGKQSVEWNMRFISNTNNNIMMIFLQIILITLVENDYVQMLTII